ncbi:IS4 family transposase [Flavobacteriaceae bacterium MHTCC 0001]
MNKSTHFSGHPIIKQLLNLVPKRLVSRTAECHDSNRYYKRFKTYEHMVCMLYATLSGVSSLRELSTVMLACEGKLSHLGLSSFPKRSTLSDANMKRSSNVFANIYYGLLNQYGSFLSDSDIKGSPVKHLNIVDSSTISLFCDILKGVGRNPINGKKKGGIKMHTMVNALQDVPCLVRFSSAATHDHTFLKELNLQKGSFVVFDKAYNDYTQYLQWTEQDIYFVTRQKDNAHYEHINELDIADHIDDNILRDGVIEIQKNEQIINLRRIAYWDNEKKKTYVFLSNNFLISPIKICDIYKRRWQIETMFKRLKQNFPLKYFLGDSQNAIEIQIWCGLIVQLLMLVVQKKISKKWAFSNMVSMIRLHLMSYIDIFKFLNDPNRSWNEVATKPPEIQLDLFT